MPISQRSFLAYSHFRPSLLVLLLASTPPTHRPLHPGQSSSRKTRFPLPIPFKKWNRSAGHALTSILSALHRVYVFVNCCVCCYAASASRYGGLPMHDHPHITAASHCCTTTKVKPAQLMCFDFWCSWSIYSMLHIPFLCFRMLSSNTFFSCDRAHFTRIPFPFSL